MTTNEQSFYRIRLKGHLGHEWSDWFETMTVSYCDGSPAETVLTGPVADQAALLGLLLKIHELNLPLVAVEQVANPKPGPSNS